MLWFFLLLLLLNQNLLENGLEELQRGQLTQAQADLESASRSDSTNALIWSALAEVYRRSQQPRLAASAAESAEKHSQANPVACHALAIYYSETGAFSKAAKFESQFAASRQARPETVFSFAQLCLRHQEFTPAAVVLESALSRFPSDPQLVLGLGVARYGQRRFDDALDLFLKVIYIDPQIQQPYSFIGRMLDQAGARLPRIQEIFANRAKENPDDPQAQFLLAKVLLAADNNDANAEPLLRKSIALENGRWESHYELGALLAARHKYQEAAAELTRSIQLNPKQPNAHYQLARVYDRLGQPEKAKEEREIHRRLTSPADSGMQ